MKTVFVVLVVLLACFFVPNEAAFEVCGEGFSGWETPCCLDQSSGWRFGYCNSSDSTFVDLCLDFWFGRCRDCATEYSCESNALGPGQSNEASCVREQLDRIRQEADSRSQLDHIAVNGHLSDLVLGHSCFWNPDNNYGYPGQFSADRRLLVESDLPYWLDTEFANAGVCPTVFNYTEILIYGDCSSVYDYVNSRPDLVNIVQSGTFSGATQTSFVGIGVWDATDAIGPYAITIVWVNTRTNPQLAGNAACSGNDLPLNFNTLNFQ